jgi:hypothetical protein
VPSLVEAEQLPTSDFREWYEDIAHFMSSLLRRSCIQSKASSAGVEWLFMYRLLKGGCVELGTF